MARTHNPFAPKERSKLETPWGVFECASPNKSRLAQIAELQGSVRALQENSDESDALEQLASLAIEMCASGLADGDAFEAAAKAAWDRDEIELVALQDAAQFVQGEMVGGVSEGND
jgi:hypothetical protein